MSELSSSETDLKDMLIQSLSANGILSRLQAQLRAAVFLALEKHNYHETMPPANNALKAILSSPDGLFIFSLVAEFLRHTRLTNTLEVFTHEASLNNIPLMTADDLQSHLALESNSNTSVLASLWDSYMSSKKTVPTVVHESRDSTSNPTAKHSESDEKNKINGAIEPSGDSLSTTPDKSPSCKTSKAMSSPPSTKTNEYDRSPHSRRDIHPLEDPHSQLDIPSPDPRPFSSNPEYQDDFDAIPSSGLKSPSGVSAVLDSSQRSKATHSPMDGSLTTRTQSPCNGKLNPPRAHYQKFDEITSRPASRNGSSSVIRVYTRSSMRTPSDEDKSDIDDDDDDEIPEVLKDYSVGGDSVDQTIDSDDSLGLDHVEEVRSIRPRQRYTTSSS